MIKTVKILIALVISLSSAGCATTEKDCSASLGDKCSQLEQTHSQAAKSRNIKLGWDGANAHDLVFAR
ncbi:hypothetical protein Brsp01_45770 [Brucella sp. NBRC 12950]|nr:hypothetical protein Brsp01_45770 [Brucella sp. NBRC 12950]